MRDGTRRTPPRTEKRAAFEPASRLVQAPDFDPQMRRPATIVAGALLVFLRVATGFAVLAFLALGHPPADAFEIVLDTDLTQGEAEFGFHAFLAFAALMLAVEAVLGALILRGVNVVRVWVMLFAVLSISAAFARWWWQDQEIRLQGELLSLSLDILILLALSSRSAAAYARRKERRPPD